MPDLLFSYGVHPVHEPRAPASWRTYVRWWLERHQIPGEFALVTQRTLERRGRDGPSNGSH
jgi:hypothetical protein